MGNIGHCFSEKAEGQGTWTSGHLINDVLDIVLIWQIIKDGLLQNPKIPQNGIEKEQESNFGPETDVLTLQDLFKIHSR